MSIIKLFCTQDTFDLVLSPGDISRLGTHPYRVYYTYINIISMDAGFFLILPSKVKISLFCLNGQPITNTKTAKKNIQGKFNLFWASHFKQFTRLVKTIVDSIDLLIDNAYKVNEISYVL